MNQTLQIMKRLTYILLICLGCVLCAPAGVYAQKKLKVEKPDLHQIRRSTLNPSSQFYYPKLQKLYDAQDTVMTPEQYRYYYFGNMYQEDYDPYRNSEFAEHTDSLLNLNRTVVQGRDSTFRAHKQRNESVYELHRLKQKLDTEGLRQQRSIEKSALEAVRDNPFDIMSIYMLSRLYQDMGKTNLARVWEYRLENLLGAIISSGSGKSREDPFVVISPDHEYFLLEVLGYDVDDYEYIEPGFDYLKVHPIDPARIPSSKTPAGFYFDVRPLKEQYNLKYPENSDEQTATGEEIVL